MSAPLQVLPSGFSLPPLPYLVGLLVAVGAVAALLYRVRAPVTPQVVAALGSWMVGGAALYALYQVDAVPDAIAPLTGSPAVYLTTFVVAGPVWAVAARYPADSWGLPSAPGILLSTGTATAAAVVGYALSLAAARGGASLFWPAVALVGSLGLAAAVWAGLRRTVPGAHETGAAGALVVVGHALDGVSTAVGTDVYGFGEQTPLSRVILEAGAALPTAPYVGAGWLFVAVKLALAAALVYALVEYVREEPERGYLLLGLVAAVGLGPGAHNLVLYTFA